MHEFPEFAEFFEALNGYKPLPWQERLANQVRENGWPSDIGVPTGLGKTSCLVIAIWSMAAESVLPAAERSLPRRIWYVVDRRLLVDAASELATRIGELLRSAMDGPIFQVAEGLRRLSALEASDPLSVVRLRGGTSSSEVARRAPDPSQPAIICSTVAMFGSRLLFRGYGSSESMWPIDAAHAGIDSLVLLDEAHLAAPLQHLLGVMRPCDANEAGVLRFPGRHVKQPGPAHLLPVTRRYPMLVNLTATGSRAKFDLDESDLDNPVVQKRLNARKPTILVEAAPGKGGQVIAQQLAAGLATFDRPVSAIAFVNDPRTARFAAEELRKRHGIEPVVLTGQLRDPDAEIVRKRLLDPHEGAPAGASISRDQPLVVIATQTLEVGADLDFDLAVSLTAGVRSMVQRWGRLNRLGDKSDARGVIVHDPTASSVYGDEPEVVWARLTSFAGELDLTPPTIVRVLGEPDDAPGRAGELLPGHLWEFAKTSPAPVAAAPPDVFFDEIDALDRRVSVMWRSVVPAVGESLYPPPSALESVELPIQEVRDFASQSGQLAVLGNDGITVYEISPDRLRPGQQVVLPTGVGGYGVSGWDPASVSSVRDLSPGIRNALHLSPGAIANWLGREVDAEITHVLQGLHFDPEEGPDPDEDRVVAEDLVRLLGAELTGSEQVATAMVERIGVNEDPVLRWVLNAVSRAAVRVDSLDELSNAPRVGLYEHVDSVGEYAGRIATALGLPPEIVEAITQSGCWHDLGKADPRFQMWLGSRGQLIAKSGMRRDKWALAAVAAGWPRGGRHELLSVQIMDAWQQADGAELANYALVRHLVLSHHGQGRPWCRVSQEGAPEMTRVDIDGHPLVVKTDPSAEDWSQPQRFRDLCETYGYWGLALLEAIVRQADHQVSAATEVI